MVMLAASQQTGWLVIARRGKAMQKRGAYGERFGGYLRVPHAPFLLARTMRQAELAVTEVRANDAPHEKSGEMPGEDAFVVALHLRDFPNEQFWEDGRLTRSAPLLAGSTAMIDLRRDPVFMKSAPFHSLHVYLPRTTLNGIADEPNATPVHELHYTPGNGVEDPVVRSLLNALRPALERPAEANDLSSAPSCSPSPPTSQGPMAACSAAIAIARAVSRRGSRSGR